MAIAQERDARRQRASFLEPNRVTRVSH